MRVQWLSACTWALLQVFTSDIRGAGTDANVDISLYGTNATVTSVGNEESLPLLLL